MSHAIHDREKILARIRRISGQAAALEKAVAQNVEDTAVLQQIAAIRGAVNGLLTVVLEASLQRHEVARVPAHQHRIEHGQLLRLLKLCLK
jgi:DNA-binding FrmR family transcriptional regulator